jgi:hypothetical protein
MHNLEPTKRGGLRRTGVAQRQSSAQITRRSVARNHPPVLTWAEKLGLPDCPYVVRWKLELPFGSLRVHHWLKPDDDRAFHDHPWWFVTLVVRGAYMDKNPNGFDILKAPALRYRPALHRHTVVPWPQGAWTIMVTGPKTRPWGFWLNGKFVKANKWFARFGHHPCD